MDPAAGRPADPERASRAGNPRASGPGRTATLEQFLAELRLMDPAAHSETVSWLSAGKRPPDLAEVARELVRNKLLTRYQAAAIYQGKGKGLLVGPYVVLDKLGRGGMGMVFKACHRDHRRIVALKILPPSFPRENPAIVERFRREAEALARARHPNIVCCLEQVREVDGAYYLVMEYVEGKDLKFLVERYGAFPVHQAIDCLLQAAKGLQVAHSLRIIHRDIKPANLMLDHRGTVRILDFGLARMILSDSWIQDEGTATGAIMGTIPYMAPEQACDSKRADARSDIYSLGCTLHFLLTGRPPYNGNTWTEMFLAHRESPIPSLKVARPKIPDHLEGLFRRMLAKDPEDRPRTMASVIASIELAWEEARARPWSSQDIPVPRPEEPDDDAEPFFDLQDLKIELPPRKRPKEYYYVGRRLKPPEKIRIRLLAKYLVLAGLATVAVILILELLFWVNAQEPGPPDPAAEGQAVAQHQVALEEARPARLAFPSSS
jgi:serine/threonine protein kinase